MLVENQLIEVRWNNFTKQHYIDRGYHFTKNNDTFFVKPEDLTHGSKAIITCKCDYCGKEVKMQYSVYLSLTDNMTKEYACKTCSGIKLSQYRTKENRQKYFDNFVALCKERQYTPVSTIDDYINSKSKLKYICPKHGIQETTYAKLYSGFGCRKCADLFTSNKLRFSPQEVFDMIQDKNGGILLNKEEYKNIKYKNLKVKCNKCGEIFITSLSLVLSTSGFCPTCGRKQISDKLRKDSAQVKEIIESKNNNVLLNLSEYNTANSNNLKIICGTCGNIFYTSLGNYSKNLDGKCPLCRENSYGEYLIALYLDKYNIKYKRQYRFKDCKDKKELPFDFYLPDYNLCIEFDGQHHYKPIWGEEHFTNALSHDSIKNDYCQQNDIDLLRIPYWERDNIEKILIEKLNLKSKEESA